MREASSNDEHSAYREAAADLVRSLKPGERLTEFSMQSYKNVGGGEILSDRPTIWYKNSDGTISSARLVESRFDGTKRLERGSTKYTPEEWARKRWRTGGSGGNFLKGEIETPQQIADELSKIRKRLYTVRERK